MIGNIVAAITDGGEAATDFESIATVTVGAGGAADITFSSIPSTYQHIQVRLSCRDNRAAAVNTIFIQVNGDTGNNYALHALAGDGSNASATGSSSVARGALLLAPSASATSNVFGSAVVDVLDYANANKNTTIRTLGGYDANGAGHIRLFSSLWNNTNAVNSLKLFPDGSASFVQYTHAALYGIKG